MRRLLFCLLFTACGGANAASLLVKPPEFNPENQTKCGVRKSQLRPLIVEWPSADRAGLEALAKRGPVFVKYTGCEMEVLSGCTAEGKYTWTGTSTHSDRVSMGDADELYAQMPLGAPKLEARLAKGGQLVVAMTIVGAYTLTGNVTRETCPQATHVIRGLTAGAFEFYQEGHAEVGAGFAGVVGGKSSAHKETLNRAGDAQSCGPASGDHPPDNCGALIRVEVEPLAGAPQAAFKPGVAQAEKEARIKVAVGCKDRTVRGPDEGLSVYLDGSPEPLAAIAVKKRFNEQEQKNIIDYVSYPVAPGSHTVRVRIPECDAQDADVNVDEGKPALVSGVLAPTAGIFAKGPTGSPDGYRLAVGVWAPFMGYGRVFERTGQTVPLTQNGDPSTVPLIGPSVSAGLLGRHWLAQLDFAMGFGSVTGTTVGYQAGQNPAGVGTIRADANITATYVGLRAGARLPFSWGALSLSLGPAIGNHSFSPTSGSDQALRDRPSSASVIGTALLGLDIQPLCDFGVGAFGGLGNSLSGDNSVPVGVLLNTGVQLYYQPNALCRRERAGDYAIVGRPE